MTATFAIDPSFHKLRVLECLFEHARGNGTQAKTLAMMAGVDAGLMGLRHDECPFKQPGHHEYGVQWHWGRDMASSTNDNTKQRRLL